MYIVIVIFVNFEAISKHFAFEIASFRAWIQMLILRIKVQSEPLISQCLGTAHGACTVNRKKNVLVVSEANAEAATTVPNVITRVVVHPVGDG